MLKIKEYGINKKKMIDLKVVGIDGCRVGNSWSTV